MASRPARRKTGKAAPHQTRIRGHLPIDQRRGSHQQLPQRCWSKKTRLLWLSCIAHVLRVTMNRSNRSDARESDQIDGRENTSVPGPAHTISARRQTTRTRPAAAARPTPRAAARPEFVRTVGRQEDGTPSAQLQIAQRQENDSVVAAAATRAGSAGGTSAFG